MAEPPLIKSGLKGACPRCGAPTLFESTIRFEPKCSACGLDFSAFNVGDGPAAFLTLILGTIIVTLALIVEMAFEPPFWVHILLWLPLTLLAVIGGLRVAKGMLIASEYRNRAREGRITDDPE